MKLVDHAGLMALPDGTIFQEFNKLGLSAPKVFGGVCGNDYLEADLLPTENFINAFGDYERKILDKFNITNSGYGIWYPSGFGRDGTFEHERHYLIWEELDRRKIAEWLLDPVKTAAEMNDDPHALIEVDYKIRCDSV